MDNIVYDINQEYEEIVEEISNKYNYTDDLKRILEKIVRAVLEGKSYEDRQSFYSMLKTTPIVIIDPKSKITQKELSLQMFGNVNPHITDKEDFDQGEYGNQDISGGGAFCTTPIFDEKLNIIGIKKYIYVDGFDMEGELNQQQKKFVDLFQTGINVPHLIHELGHAYVSEEKPYEMSGNILTQRMGACNCKYRITPLGNEKYECEQIAMENVFIEEGLNSNFEEDTLAKYLGLSLEEVNKLYDNVFPSSLYQPRISNMTRRLSDSGFKADLDNWRRKGDTDALLRINQTFSKTNYYEKRAKLFERKRIDEGDPDRDIIAARNYIFNNPESDTENKVLKKLEKDFFPDTDLMSPMDMMNNILLEYYDSSIYKYNFSVKRYKKILDAIAAKGIGLINQAHQIRADEKQKQEQKNI